MLRANWNALKNYEVVIPTGGIAEKFSSPSVNVIAQQQALVFEIQNLRRARDLLSPRLLSEQVDLGAEAESARDALIEGERRGQPQDFDFAVFTRRKTAQHGG